MYYKEDDLDDDAEKRLNHMLNFPPRQFDQRENIYESKAYLSNQPNNSNKIGNGAMLQLHMHKYSDTMPMDFSVPIGNSNENIGAQDMLPGQHVNLTDF